MRDVIETHHSADIRWHDEQFYRVQFIIIFLYLYSDKSKTGLKKSGLTFYSFQLNCMSVSDIMNNSMPSNGHAFWIIRRSIFLCNARLVEGRHKPRENRKDEERTSNHRRGHDPVGVKSSYWDFSSYTGKPVRLHIVAGLNSTDIREEKDMVSVKYSNLTKISSSLCHVLAQDLKPKLKVIVRNLEETRKSIR